MVKHVRKRVIALPIGRVTMGVDELLEILETQEFEKVTAKNGEFEFESLDDIKKNKAMITGNPYFECDGIYLAFSRAGTSIRCFNPKEDSYEKSMSLFSSIKEKKSLEDIIGDVFGKIIAVNLVLSMIALASVYYFEFKVERGPIQLAIAITISSAMFGLAILFSRHLYLEVFRKSIQPKKTEGWIKRHWSQIVASVVTAIIVLVLTTLVRDFMENPAQQEPTKTETSP